MSKVIDGVRHKIASGQNLFRRSTIEKMLAEYDRLLMRNTALEKNAVENTLAPDGAYLCGKCGQMSRTTKCENCGHVYQRPQVNRNPLGGSRST